MLHRLADGLARQQSSKHHERVLAGQPRAEASRLPMPVAVQVRTDSGRLVVAGITGGGRAHQRTKAVTTWWGGGKSVVAKRVGLE